MAELRCEAVFASGDLAEPDFDQTVHGPLGDHVAPVAAQAEA
jgi:hypothetical protein